MQAHSLRDDQLLAVLQTRERASVAELARVLDVGEATVRRHLHRLARDGRVLRTYGGAMVPSVARAPGTPVETDASVERKRAIGEAAAGLVQDGETIVIGSGTTSLELARRLRGRSLTVITNSLDAANALVDDDGIELIVLGGVVRPRIHSLLGHLTEQASHDLRADRLFTGVSAIDLERGCMSDHVPETRTDRAMRDIAREVVVLADSSKFDTVAPAFMFGLDAVATIVTDEGIRPEMRAALAERGIAVAVATTAQGDHRTQGSGTTGVTR